MKGMDKLLTNGSTHTTTRSRDNHIACGWDASMSPRRRPFDVTSRGSIRRLGRRGAMRVGARGSGLDARNSEFRKRELTYFIDARRCDHLSVDVVPSPLAQALERTWPAIRY